LLKLSPTDKLDSIKLNHVSRLLSELDSLQRGLPSEGKLAAKMDSIKQASLQKIKEKLSFKERVNIPLNDQEKSFLQKHGLPLDKLNLSNRLDGIDIPKLPGSSNGNDLSSTLDKVKGNGDLTNKLPSIPTVQGIVPEQLKTAVDRANSVKEELGSVKDDIKEAKEKGLDYTEHADELAEESLKKLKEVKALEGQLSAAEKLKQAQQAELEKIKNAQAELEKIKNAQHLRDQLASGKVTEKVLANEEQVKAYMEKMAKYKKKFDKLPDIRYVPKIKPNAMKGRPLKERFAPGMLFQIVKSDQTVSWYLAPEVLYKFSGTFSGGVAGVYRFQYNLSPKVIWDNPTKSDLGQPPVRLQGNRASQNLEELLFAFRVGAVKLFSSRWPASRPQRQVLGHQLVGGSRTHTKNLQSPERLCLGFLQCYPRSFRYF